MTGSTSALEALEAWGEGVTDVNYTGGPARDERADDRKELLGGGAGLER